MKDPAKQELKAWIKFKAEHATTPTGVCILLESYRSPSERTRKLLKLLRYVRKQIEADKIWKAKIYDQPGNKLISDWKLPFENTEPDPKPF